VRKFKAFASGSPRIEQSASSTGSLATRRYVRESGSWLGDCDFLVTHFDREIVHVAAQNRVDPSIRRHIDESHVGGASRTYLRLRAKDLFPPVSKEDRALRWLRGEEREPRRWTYRNCRYWERRPLWVNRRHWFAGRNVRSWFGRGLNALLRFNVAGAKCATKSWLSYRSLERLEADLATSPSVCFEPVSFGSNNTIEDPSSRLARYIARSAWCIISSASAPLSGISAAPDRCADFVRMPSYSDFTFEAFTEAACNCQSSIAINVVTK